MGLKQSGAPAVEPISLTEGKLHLRIDSTAEDVLICSLIKAARQYCENYQQRAYITQTLELWLDRFPDIDIIDVPLPPLQSITSIKYYDTANIAHTFASSEYFVDSKSQPGRVSLAYGKFWPTDTLRPTNGVCITFVAGYGSAASAVPATACYAILLLVAHYYENREAAGASQIYQAPLSVDALLWQERCF